MNVNYAKKCHIPQAHGDFSLIAPHLPEFTLSRLCLEALWREKGRWWVPFGRVNRGEWKVLPGPKCSKDISRGWELFPLGVGPSYHTHSSPLPLPPSLCPLEYIPPDWVLRPYFEDPWTMGSLLTYIPTCRASLHPSCPGIFFARTWLQHTGPASWGWGQQPGGQPILRATI